MGIKLANIEATRKAESKDAELQRDVEIQRAQTELEARRATDLVHAKIERESAQQEADAKFYGDSKSADGLFYAQKQKAEASYLATVKGADALVYQQKQEAEVSIPFSGAFSSFFLFFLTFMELGVDISFQASFYRATKEAEAAFVAKQREADGITEMAKAYQHLSSVLGGPQGLLQYIMLQNNTHEKLAKANAQAINGLQPKISVWNTGDNAGGSSADAMAPVRNLMQSLPPLLSTINEQTGIAPPGWLAKMAGGGGQGDGVMVKGEKKMVNGS